jgi:hypothetical protein
VRRRLRLLEHALRVPKHLLGALPFADVSHQPHETPDPAVSIALRDIDRADLPGAARPVDELRLEAHLLAGEGPFDLWSDGDPPLGADELADVFPLNDVGIQPKPEPIELVDPNVPPLGVDE